MSEANVAMIALQTVPRRSVAALALLLALLPHSARAACTGPAGSLEAVVCADAALSHAWTDITTSLSEISAAHPELSTALAEDQQLFSELLTKTLQNLRAEHPADAVPGILLTGLEDRLAFLRAIAPLGAGGFAGSWQNAAGAVRLTPAGETEANLSISVSDPIMGLHTCSIESKARISAGLLLADLPPADEASLTLIGDSGLLGVDYTRAGRTAQGPLRCGGSAPVSGWYFNVTETE